MIKNRVFLSAEMLTGKVDRQSKELRHTEKTFYHSMRRLFQIDYQPRLLKEEVGRK